MGQESSVPTLTLTTQTHLGTGREEGVPTRGSCEPCFPLQSLSTQNSPSTAPPGPAGCAEASWVPQSQPGSQAARLQMGSHALGHAWGGAFPHVPRASENRHRPGPGPFPQAFCLCRGCTRRTEAAWAQGCG